jgi:hypothetical protein
MRRFLFDSNALNAFVDHRGAVPERTAEARLRGDQVVDMIAAIAFSLGNCTVVSSDTDLTAVPGLAVVNWAS